MVEVGGQLQGNWEVEEEVSRERKEAGPDLYRLSPKQEESHV